MKKTNKILAALITLCLVIGVAALIVSATDGDTYSTVTVKDYDFENYNKGASTAEYIPSGSGNADKYSVSEVRVGAGGNKYASYSSINTANASQSYRRDIIIGTYSSTDKASGHKLNDYSYYTVDFDICADGYAIPIGYEITSESVTDSSATVTVDSETTDEETGITTIIKSSTITTVKTYTVRIEYYIFNTTDADSLPAREDIEAAIAAQITKFNTQLAAAIKDIADNNGAVTTTAGTPVEDAGAKTVTITNDVKKTIVESVNSYGSPFTGETVADEYIGSLPAYDYDSAVAGKRLSYSDGMYFHIDNRPQYSEGGDYKSGYNRLYVKLLYEDGQWKVYAAASSTTKDTGFVLSDKLGEWNHFTYAIKTVAKTSTDSNCKTGITYGNSVGTLYLNGNRIISQSAIIGSYVARSAYITPRAIDMQPGHYSDEYSMGIDNLVSTFYPVVTKAYVADDEGNPTTTRDPLNDVHYTSGDDVVGIDDLFAGTVSSISECEDVVYSASYVAPSPNGYVTVDGGQDKIYVPYLQLQAAATIRDGHTLETTADLLGITPIDGASFDIICSDGITVTLSDTAKGTHELTKTATGYRVEANNQLKLATSGSGKNLVYGTYAYDDNEGNNSGSSWSGGQQLGSYSYHKVIADEITGNKYYAFYRNTGYNYATATTSDKGYNNGSQGWYEWNTSDWASSASGYKNNDLLSNYDYAVFDMDFGADRYSAFVGYRVGISQKDSKSAVVYSIEKAYKTFLTEPTDEMLSTAIDENYAAFEKDLVTYAEGVASLDMTDYSEKISVKEARSSVSASFVNGMSFYLGVRTNSDDTAYSKDKNSGFYCWAYVVKSGNDWYLSSNKSFEASKDYKLPSDPGQLTHITFVVRCDHANGKVFIDGYANGTKFSNVSGSVKVMAIDSMRLQMPTDYKDEDIYGLAFDNLSINYYERGYSSGAGLGIDDFAAGNCKLWECVDTVWNGYYTSPNGPVSVDGGEASYIKPVIDEILGNIKDGSVINAGRSIYGLTLGEAVQSITVNASNAAKIWLSDESALDFIVETISVDGYSAVYRIRRATEADAINITVIDAEGNVIVNTTLLPNAVLDTTKFNGNIYDVENKLNKIVTEWYWDLDGDGTAYSEELASSFGVSDVLAVGGTNVTVYPKFATGAPTTPFIIYYNDGIANRVWGELSNYDAVSDFPTAVESAPDVATAVLFYDDVFSIGGESINIGEGKSFTLDLNGRTFVRKSGSLYPEGVFKIKEGASINVTSTADGARVYAIDGADTANGNLFSTGGFISISEGVDGARVSLSNFEFNGGTMIRNRGGEANDATSCPTAGGDKIYATVDNVKAYAPLRSSYAVFMTQAPDFVATVRNSSFFTSNETYSIVHDYQSTGSTKYFSSSDISFYDCEIMGWNEQGKLAKFAYNLNKDSRLYLEDTTIVAKYADQNSASKASLTVGPGVVIATNSKNYFINFTIYANEGVEYIVNNKNANQTASLTFNHSALKNDVSIATSNTTLDSYIFDRNLYVESVATATVYFVSFAKDDIPDSVGSLVWKDQNGEVISTGYEFVGVAPTAPKTMAELGIEDEVYSWYSTTYKWAEQTTGETNVAAGENVFVPTSTEATHINGKKANMSLTTGMIFNLYIPLPDESVKAGSVYSADAIAPVETVKVDGADMLKLSFASALDDFAPTTVTVRFATKSGKDLTYAVKIDALQYVTLLANTYECGTEEAQLAYEIVAYKKAVATYLAAAETISLEEYLDASELSAIAAFEAVFTGHADGCSCTAGLYDDEAVKGESVMDVASYTSVGINGFAYLLNTDTNGLRINMKSDSASTVKRVSYADLLGTVVLHDKALGNLNLIETENGSYYVVSGISASDVCAVVTVTLDVGGVEKTVTYSLGQYINSTDAQVAKALYSYSKAVAAYKGITASEKQ